MKPTFVYIIQSELNKKYYVGSSNDLVRRLSEHNAGKNLSTRKKGPWILKFSQIFENCQEARQAEYYLKRMKSRDYIDKIIRRGYIRGCSSVG